MKKIRNFIFYFARLFFIKIFRLEAWSRDVKIKELFSYKRIEYISNKLRFIFTPDKKIGKYFIDSTLIKTNLCKLGEKHQTDKSPFNRILHRHPYTSIYNLLFSTLKNKKINFAEIGILNNSSIRMWREYFPYAKIFGFEFDEELIKKAKKDKLKNVFYKNIDVTNSKSISDSFKSCHTKFDIIIDDSTHTFVDQIKIIKKCYNFLYDGGFLIIEDIPKKRIEYQEENFYKELKEFLKYFDFVSFIDCNHINRFSKGWSNDKILVMIRNSKK